MEVNEAQELQEHAEHAEHESSMRPVALTMAILAALVAVTTLLGHRTHTEAVIEQTRAAVEQNRASDMWTYYQAKKIRSNDTELATGLMQVLAIADKKAAEKVLKGFEAKQEKWAEELKEEEKQAREREEAVKQHEEAVEAAEVRAIRFDLGEVLLEIGLVITSVTLLTRRRMYWFVGMAASLAGIVSTVLGVLAK